MPDNDTKPAPPAEAKYAAPKGVEKTLTLRSGGRRTRVRATADWIVIRENGIPAAEIFYASYQAEPRNSRRPITFLFNGGPGAASAFLHMGTAGPRRIEFGPKGSVLAPPARVVDNAESWLKFSDLVFVDPVGTGFSRTVHESRLEQNGLEAPDDKREKRTKELPEANKGFFKLKRDIAVLCEFASAFLSRMRRWESPVIIAGESYGGFRVGKLVRALPERGIGLSGAIMVSPVMDFLHLLGSDYDLWPWTSTVPTMALAARRHAKGRGRFATMSEPELREASERFVNETLGPVLLNATRSERERDRALSTLADLTGMPMDLVQRWNGRIRIDRFARELLREEGKVCGLYDAVVTGANVFPDREEIGISPDPTLAGISAAFTAGVNTMLRSELGLTTDREYTLINWDAGSVWADDRPEALWARQLECSDDVRYGLALNPSLNLLISHGWYDLVTPYFSSARSVEALRLPRELRERVKLTNYDGGHMFYTWESSRKGFTRDVERVMRGVRA